MQSARDDIVTLPVDVTRVVSIVPSSTESIAVTHASLIVGATDYRTHPADLGVVRVRGTKNPDLERIRGLAPDVVLANAEENRAVDLDVAREWNRGVGDRTDDPSPNHSTHSNACCPRSSASRRPGWLMRARCGARRTTECAERP